MTRPTDWYLVDQPVDPTPGDPWGVKQLANEYGSIATTAGEVATIVKLVKSTSATGIWIGAAGDSFRTKLDTLPDDATKCATSYGIARDAMTYWASQMTDAQTTADTNLTKARLAQADLDTAKTSLAAAMVTQATASQKYQHADDLVQQYKNTTPPPNLKIPTPWELQQARNANANASSTVTTANNQIATAQAALDAAKRGTADAKDNYDNAARTVVAKLQTAKNAGVRADTWWESIYHSDAWNVLITIVTVTVIVLAVVAIFATGPFAVIIGAILAAGSVLLLADSLAKFLEGEMSIGEFGLAVVLTVLPGGKAIQAIGRTGRLFAAGSSLATTTRLLKAGGPELRIIQHGIHAGDDLIGVPSKFKDIFAGGRTPKSSELRRYAEEQGWTLKQNPNGPPKYVDENGIPRITIKSGSERAEGSGLPHVEYKGANGQRFDPATGNAATRKDPLGNHRNIEIDD